MGRYERPPTLDAALQILDSGSLQILAGGTDFYPVRVGRAIVEDVLDVTAIAGLKGISEETDHWRIGALTTWSEFIETPLPALFDGYKLAAREVGGRQIQNTGTVAGNLCNASPAADGTPNLLALDAQVELASSRGLRRQPVARFVTGNRETTREADEIVTALIVPKPRCVARSSFVKLGARKYLVISIVMVAAVIELSPQGLVRRARIAVGSCSRVPQRLERLETALEGLAPSHLAEAIRVEHVASLSPISDIRASAGYRIAAAAELIRRALRMLGRC
jgi:CO/xanthine dehydrogenase FAD-binding subunit